MPTRRTALFTLLGGLASLSPALHAARFRVYSRCLPDYLAALAREAYERRNAALAGIQTAGDVRARQQWVRRTFWELVGGEPERTPLALQSAAGFERKGYKLEKLSYESAPGVRIPANLYTPTTGRAPYPGVLFQMGHSLNGKAYESYQKCCQGLARLGYVVLAFDPFGQGERTYYHVGDADEEHSRPGRQMLLVGQTATRQQVWDAVRSLDVLAALPQVDPKRLASMGQSGGGTLTMLLGAVDDRLSCAVVSSGNTENFACAGFNPPGSTDDAEQDFIGSGPVGFDRWDLLYPLAPKPLLVLVTERDSFGTYSPSYIASGEEEFEKLRRMYELLGAGDKLQWKASALPHALSHQMRLHAYDFLERWMQGHPGSVAEPEVAPEPEEALLVGVQSARPPMNAPTPAAIDAAGLRGLLRIGVGRIRPVGARAIPLMVDHGERCDIETFEVESAPGVFVPGYLFVPPAEAPKRSLVLLADPRGRASQWREGGLCHELAAQGHMVCAFDVRGVGDMSPEAGRGNPGYTLPHASEEHYAWASLILGRPLLGQRVEDILAVAQAVGQWRGAGRTVTLAARGHLALPALCASALDASIATTYLAGGLISWAALMQVDDYKEPFSSFLPGVLLRTDLPYIARLAQPRRVVLAGAVDAAGVTASGDAVRALYGAGVEVRATAAWDQRALASL
jgi:dienelactone hydrolase